MRAGFRIAMAAALLLLVPAAVKGADMAFAYQGRLLDEKGNVLSEREHSIVFSIYDQAAGGGQSLWSCTRSVSLSADGQFSVDLSGSGPSGESLGDVLSANASKTLYIGLAVDGEHAEIEPRQKLLSVPMALRAGDALAAPDDIAVSSNLVGSVAAVTEDASANSLAVAGEMKIDGDGKLMAGSMSVSDISVSGSITGNGAIPVGGIVIWSGFTTTIPEGWALCDGRTSNGHTTPNLSNKFVLGAGGKYAVDATGGDETVALKVENIPQHRHSYYYKGGSVSALAWKSANDFYDKTGHYSKYSDDKGYTEATGGKQGKTVPHNNMPPYYALCYIMRVK